MGRLTFHIFIIAGFFVGAVWCYASPRSLDDLLCVGNDASLWYGFRRLPEPLKDSCHRVFFGRVCTGMNSAAILLNLVFGFLLKANRSKSREYV